MNNADALRTKGSYSRTRLLVSVYCCTVGLRGRPRASFYNSPPSESVFLMGLIDSVVGIISGAVFAIAPQLAALLASLGLPV